MKKTKAKNKKKRNVFVITLSILLIAMIVLLLLLFNKLAFWKNSNTKPINDGSQINGINLSGMTPSEAYTTVDSYIDQKAKDFSLSLKYNDQIFTLDKDDYVINKDIHTIIDIASGKELEANLGDNNYFINENDSKVVSFNYIFKGLDDKINEICEKIETKPINSCLSFNPDSDNIFEITPSSKGYVIDREKLYDEINKQFANTNNILVDLNLVEKEADITEEHNKDLTHLVSSFTTNVSDSTGGRKNNVKLALSKFNGMIVEPHETVSFNEITSPHTLENGYKIATIIYKGRFVDGVGGGICQASTTLYNALLLAGADIQEVHKHSLPVKYVPLALDAMVSEGSSDLVFTNNTDYPMFIKTTSTSEDVSVEIYSKPIANGITYKTRSETIEELPALDDKIIVDTNQEYSDKVVFKGETYRLTYARKGYDVKSYLQTWQEGKMIDEKEIRHEIYQPQPGIIIEGSLEPIENLQIIDEEHSSDTLNDQNNFLFETTNNIWLSFIVYNYVDNYVFCHKTTLNFCFIEILSKVICG